MGKRKASSEPPSASSDSTAKRLRKDTKPAHADPTTLVPKLDPESDSDNLQEIYPEEITVAIFCALPYEAVAVKYSLDEEYTCRPRSIGPQKYVYSYGRINHHKVVIARPHYMGTIQAAHCASAVRQQFVHIQFAFAVGTGTAIPNASTGNILLGDVAVGVPQDNHPGVIQYDFGKYDQEGFILKGCLRKPPAILVSADGSLEEDEEMGRSRLKGFFKRVTQKRGYAWPSSYEDPSLHHSSKINIETACCQSDDSCDKKLLPRQEVREPVVHRGLILSGNGVVNNIRDADVFRRGYKDAICFDTESAGIMDEIPCLVIRGICDYASTHKQDGWHRYASAVAAAYCKAVLYKVPEHISEDTGAVGILTEEVRQLSNQIRYLYGRVHHLEQSRRKTFVDNSEDKTQGLEVEKHMSKSVKETTRSLEESKVSRQYNFYGPVMYAESTSSQEQGKG